jgi:ribosomal protein S18 acetylase RimI-like enzyme
MEKPVTEYRLNDHLSVADFIDLLQRSTLAERRPVNDPHRIEKMLQHANLVVTAYHNNQLVGVARSLTDFAYCTYLADLAVDETCQHQGIGKELIRQTRLAAPQATLILLSAPKAVDYYPKIGMERHEACFIWRSEG